MNCSAVKHLKIIPCLFRRACAKLAGIKGTHFSIVEVKCQLVYCRLKMKSIVWVHGMRLAIDKL